MNMRNDTTCTGRVKPLEHHIFDGAWIAHPSKPHPIMSVQLTLLPEDHAALGFPIKDRSRLNNHHPHGSRNEVAKVPSSHFARHLP
ncbi:hypothetical protein RRG08_004430 [Elysia crispata]|uniref:Uncharacterized protein n=1 Tax=Elysia crispata TaxID=231223 RepID=A0AAE1DXM3_9GAST|nr:hypothetical protein RRG08_004430 [Elysia crispata]